VGGSDDGDGSSQPASTTTTDITTTETTEQPKPPPRPKPKPKKPKQRVKDALNEEIDAGGYAGELDVKDFFVGTREVNVTVETPEGGFQGASCNDLNDGARAVFRRIYGDADWKHDSVVVFEGSLVSKETGKDLPDAKTGIFTLRGGQARRIDWSDEEAISNIDWSLYRDFCHPALK
jgi:hypothetical protein